MAHIRAPIIIVCLLSATHSQELVGFGLPSGDQIWRDRGSGARGDVAIWEPLRPGEDWRVVGHYAQGNYNGISQPVYTFRDVSENGTALATPLAFTPIWDDQGTGSREDCSIWRPTCPEGYVSLGDFAYRANRISDPVDLYAKVSCVKRSLVHPCYFGNKIWDDSGSGGWLDVSLWGIVNETEPETVTQYFLSSPFHNIAPTVQPYCMKRTSFVDIS